jgi:dGTPase
MAHYKQLSEEIEERIVKEKLFVGTPNEAAIRRNQDRDKNTVLRPAYVRDIEKIIHSPFYNRYADKTQVFSFYRNDDISRRAIHVQLVSRIARNIGRMLGLNLDLIEAMALGHDIGHTPFGHAGERILSQLLYDHTKRYFNHNVHSVRVLDGMFCRNISLQTLDGILCHNGEFEMQEYRPVSIKTFDQFDEEIRRSYTEENFISSLVPCTLEACVVRICDIIAYIGKDRQDAAYANIHVPEGVFSPSVMGTENAEMINNLTVNIVENSYGKDYICLDKDYYEAIKLAKKENYQYIYQNEEVERQYKQSIQPMFEMMYEHFLVDIRTKNKNSILFRHHIEFMEKQRGYYEKEKPYIETEPNQIVVDYLASMTDDYFLDLFAHLFPKSPLKVQYISYFDVKE